MSGNRATVTVRQDGQMPSPVVLKVELGGSGAATTVSNAKMIDAYRCLAHGRKLSVSGSMKRIVP